MLIYGIVMTLACLSLVVRPDRQAQRTQERVEEGRDTFFEEQRTYAAYPWLRDPRRLRLMGSIGVAGGLVVCLIELTRA